MIGPRTYLLAFDASKNPHAITALHQYIKDSKDFVGFWNYIPFVYAVKTYQTLAVVREKLHSILTNGSYLLAEIGPGGIDGYLPSEAWGWFSYDHGQLSLTQFGGSALGGDFGGLFGQPNNPLLPKR
jgi:hypothetical protein